VLAELLAGFPLPTLWAHAALTDDRTVRDRLHDYLTKTRNERPLLTARDLLDLGIPEGPDIGETLRHLRNARLDAEVETIEDEKRLARRL
jgi:tRNA nucleotidyltransferase (CCA-adding enzyme)